MINTKGIETSYDTQMWNQLLWTKAANLTSKQGYHSMVEKLPNMCKALCRTLRTAKWNLKRNLVRWIATFGPRSHSFLCPCPLPCNFSVPSYMGGVTLSTLDCGFCPKGRALDQLDRSRDQAVRQSHSHRQTSAMWAEPLRPQTH